MDPNLADWFHSYMDRIIRLPILYVQLGFSPVSSKHDLELWLDRCHYGLGLLPRHVHQSRDE